MALGETNLSLTRDWKSERESGKESGEYIFNGDKKKVTTLAEGERGVVFSSEHMDDSGNGLTGEGVMCMGSK